MTGTYAAVPPHGRAAVPEDCRCTWVKRTCELDGPVWWQMQMRSELCLRHPFESDSPYYEGMT